MVDRPRDPIPADKRIGRPVQPPRACISRCGSSRSFSISMSPPSRSPIRSSALRSSAPRSRRDSQPARMKARISPAEMPARNGLRRSVPAVAYRQRYHMPSAVTRLRSQVEQNGVVVEGIMPNVAPSGKTNRCAGADPRSGIGSILP